MQKVLTAAEMREVDRLTTEKYGVSPAILMENAAHGAANAIRERLGGSVKDKSVLILCGKGNNGGDGAALGRVLWQQGADVEVCLFGLVEDTKDEARANFEILQKITGSEEFELDQADLAFTQITGLDEWLEYDSLNFQCDDPDVIVDALFGTGLERPLDGVYEQAAAFIDAFTEDNPNRETLVVALDIPSGLNADRGKPIGPAARAHVTITFTAPKLASVLPPAQNFVGDLEVVNIGTPCELVNATRSKTYLSECADVCRWMVQTEFSSASYKNKRGHALIVAGSSNYAGAAVLAGNAAIRSGAGLATIATPESSRTLVGGRVAPEVMVRGVAETECGAISEDAFDEIVSFSKNIDAVGLGCGLSSSDESTRRFVRRMVEERKTPLVIDADGLNSLAPWDTQGSTDFPLVLTPHEGEFMKLLGTDDKSVLDDRLTTCREFAGRFNVILLLKGERNLIAEPGGRVVVNPTGNSGLGKAGNGDTLNGILAGFVAQAVQMKADIFETVVAAVYVAGLAGDIAEQKYGKRVMTATDVRDCLQEAFEQTGG